jgi:hypothetical protein
MGTTDRNPLEPFATTIRVVVALLVLLIVTSIGATIFGSGSFLGIGDNTTACAVAVPSSYSSEDDAGLARLKKMVPPGVGMNVHSLNICDYHPNAGQRAAIVLTQAPSALLYLAVFVLFLRLIRKAGREGPFTPGIITQFHVLGWTLLAGGYLANALQDGAQSTLLATVTTPGTELHPNLTEIIFQGIFTLSWSTLLTGLGLLTLARILHIGVHMREDLVGTV